MTEETAKKRILVVDDDPGIVRFLEASLHAAGFEVAKCYNGQEALAAVKQSLPDLIILDRMMPKMDGLKTCALIKADRRFRGIPVIMVTASADAADERLSAQVKVDAFINKPINIPELMRKVEELIVRV